MDEFENVKGENPSKKEKEDLCSESYPLGGMVEPVDIEKEKERKRKRTKSGR